ncbi:MAG TPA: DUF1003 domain-containing protein [Bryobacteraceae bacterium]|nr:DUF1003 domain-containing protein [Bryobacteraceae bacterium]
MAEQNSRQARANIETVARLENEFLESRTTKDRIGDAIAGFIGTMTFVILHLVLLVVWFVVNLGVVPAIQPFDPYPFVLLAVIVSVEGVLLSTFILMKQNRMSRRAEERDHLNLQIDLLAEKEITKILQMQRRLCQHLGINIDDAETLELSRHTAVEDLARELKEKLPAE